MIITVCKLLLFLDDIYCILYFYCFAFLRYLILNFYFLLSLDNLYLTFVVLKSLWLPSVYFVKGNEKELKALKVKKLDKLFNRLLLFS